MSNVLLKSFYLADPRRREGCKSPRSRCRPSILHMAGNMDREKRFAGQTMRHTAAPRR